MTQKARQYLNNKDLLEEVKKSKTQKQMTDELARMLIMLTERYARRGNFAGYTYNEDMQGYALMQLVHSWNAFNPEKSDNPFAFFTQCIKHSFIQYLNVEKRQRNIRDEILMEQGRNPSWTYNINGKGQRFDVEPQRENDVEFTDE